MKTFLTFLFVMACSSAVFAQNYPTVYSPPVVYVDRGHAPPLVVIENPNAYAVNVPVHCEGISTKKKKVYSVTKVYQAKPGYSTHPFPVYVAYWDRVACW